MNQTVINTVLAARQDALERRMDALSVSFDRLINATEVMLDTLERKWLPASVESLDPGAR
jgi:hypothetical protein